ncbi:hypothetical protein BDZ91DRAFT_828382 [Kalaharituber pfeilii]|nr:hypothetical protein BDZ91DRAFT_828382 [Kalaharituber pfeilii]
MWKVYLSRLPSHPILKVLKVFSYLTEESSEPRGKDRISLPHLSNASVYIISNSCLDTVQLTPVANDSFCCDKCSRIDKLAILGDIFWDNRLTLIPKMIIEFLKYATTCDPHPNSKGGVFVHDPQMCREKEEMAGVKLSFILVAKNGEGSTLSSNIFVRQKPYWNMSYSAIRMKAESFTLKKFDEIFEALKYTNAIKRIET